LTLGRFRLVFNRGEETTSAALVAIAVKLFQPTACPIPCQSLFRTSPIRSLYTHLCYVLRRLQGRTSMTHKHYHGRRRYPGRGLTFTTLPIKFSSHVSIEKGVSWVSPVCDPCSCYVYCPNAKLFNIFTNPAN